MAKNQIYLPLHYYGEVMKLIQRILKTLVRRASTKFMDRVGSKVVSGMTDTSSDAPSAFYEPKRDHYEKMKNEEKSGDKNDPID